MPEKPPNKPGSNVRLWIALIGAIGAAIAIIPPAITAVKSTPGINQSGNGNSVIQGSTVNSNNNTTLVSMWIDGVRSIIGSAPVRNPRSPASPVSPPPTTSTLNQGAAEPKTDSIPTFEAATPERGAIGRLVINASLANDATWSPEASRVNRFLTFYFRAEATAADDKPGTLDATLSRDGKDVCTISLNTQTSANSNGVRNAISICNDTIPVGASFSYRAKVKASGMTPIAVRLDHVDAVWK